MNSKVETGRTAEDRAASYLLSLGYTIITRNYRIRGGEIDLIALDGEVLVFVEVRWRTDDMGDETIGPKKAEALRRTMRSYMDEMGEERDFRCDLIALSPRDLRHHPDFLNS
ncbi:MAG: YraN family protein [Armatimonadetes bacterium]|nr:YraN family protein [Armatimonadota bacterium]